MRFSCGRFEFHTEILIARLTGWWSLLAEGQKSSLRFWIPAFIA